MRHQHAHAFDPSNFTTDIDNPYLPLHPGTTFTYQEFALGEVDVVTVTYKTKVVDGVRCVVVRDTAYENGEKVEDTRDFFAQDSDGNVWYFGERTREFEPGNPDPISTEGSWLSGRHGATAGIVMLANPQVGNTYAQEDAPGVAEDFATVLALDAWADVGYGQFNDLLQTEDVNPLDPSVENKFYAIGVGNILTTTEDGEFAQLMKIEVNGTGADNVLRGYFGADTMRGFGGADTLRGNRGGDTLDGGSGDDELWGGTGADTFVFKISGPPSSETDIIRDYLSAEHDVIDLGPGGPSDIVSDVKVPHGGWQLTLTDGHVIVLAGGLRDTNHDGHIVDQLFFA